MDDGPFDPPVHLTNKHPSASHIILRTPSTFPFCDFKKTQTIEKMRKCCVLFLIALVVLGPPSSPTTIGIHVEAFQSNISQERILLQQNRRKRFLPSLLFQSQKVLGGEGMPSNPGWKLGRLERLTEWAESKEANRPVICEYESSGMWLWTKWTGTVLKSTWRDVVLSMLATFLFHLYLSCKHSWPIFSVAQPDTSAKLISGLLGLKKLWEYQLTLATFILTFFTSQAFTYWQKVYNTTRIIQGRINDICMLIIMGARRGGRNHSDDKMKGRSALPNKRFLEENAEEMVRTSTRLIRMSHILFWAATPTASNGLNDCDKFIEDAENCPLPVDDEHIGPLLLSKYGLRALVSSGELTREETRDLMLTRLPPSQYAYVLLVWAGLRIMKGFEDGTMRNSPGMEENILRQLTALRASMFDIADFRAGRMPLAYVQLVQVLVDSLCVVAPFALYPEVGSLSILLVGLLTFFFRGLLSLSKSFLDPFGVEGFDGQNIRVDVLVSEINFGAGQRWINAASRLPPSVC
jgi:hypothetical protein